MEKRRRIKKEYSRNETIARMHENTASAFRRVSDFVEKYKYDWEDCAEYLREAADELEAQAIVVELRDQI